MINEYSANWYEVFVPAIPTEQTEREVRFIAGQLPLPRYQGLVDIGCGTGRHALRLARLGYQVTGIDVNETALAVARRNPHPNLRFERLDMRRVATLDRRVDAFLCLWQSFGYFNDDENEGVLRQISEKLAVHGRLVLDLYHRGFFEDHEGVRVSVRGTTTVTERKHVAGNRLRVTLEYDDRQGIHVFDWRVYHPEEIVVLARRVGFECRLQCCRFDAEFPPARSEPRMQVVLQRSG